MGSDTQQIQDSGDLILTLKSERNSLPSAGWRKHRNFRQANLLGSHSRSKTKIQAISGDSGEQKHQKILPHEEIGWTKWGVNLKILRQVYTGNVRPVAENVSSSWSTASKANKTRINKVQNIGLRITHGAIKSTPV